MKNSIKDFGNQFKYHNKVDNYWGSLEMLKDIVSPFDLTKIKNKTICEVGVGSGRILKNLSKMDPDKIYAIEPSEAIEVAKINNLDSKEKIIFKNITGQSITLENEIDYTFSLGVIHHIPEAEVVCKKIYKSLKKNGKFIIWLYGKEGNFLYLLIFDNLRKFTKLLPDKFLNLISVFLNLNLSIYIFLCKYFKLPLRGYINNVISKCSFEKRTYIIFDQLNPSYSKYYTKNEVSELLKSSGFKKIEIYNRYDYSWTAIAEK
jgi:SAM-dependent methyltransferase